MWVYRSPIGDLYIKELPNGLFGLEYDGVIWEACDTPQAEADNVYMQCTGCSCWDLFEVPLLNDVPHDLSEWEEI